jgi:hypothetical protein
VHLESFIAVPLKVSHILSFLTGVLSQELSFLSLIQNREIALRQRCSEHQDRNVQNASFEKELKKIKVIRSPMRQVVGMSLSRNALGMQHVAEVLRAELLAKNRAAKLAGLSSKSCVPAQQILLVCHIKIPPAGRSSLAFCADEETILDHRVLVPCAEKMKQSHAATQFQWIARVSARPSAYVDYRDTAAPSWGRRLCTYIYFRSQT